VPAPRTERTPALILRSVDFGESDRILHLLVPDGGRLTAIAKGARRSVRRFGGTLDLFNQLNVQLHRRRGLAMSRLEGAVLVRHWAPLRSDPVRFALGCYLLELLDRLAPEDGAARDTRHLFRFAVEALDALAAHRPDQTLRTILELRALDALGLRPELRRCVGCGREPEGEREVSFHVADGGPVCGACAARRTGLVPVQLGTLRALERSLALPVDQLGRLALSPRALADARRVVERFERFHVGVELQSRSFLDRMLPAPASVGGNRPAVPV
jgi:DNA repair protein RecO (recombination protein O)